MAHSKVYGFCDAKCKVEVVPKKGGTLTGTLEIESNTYKQFRIKRTDMDRTTEQVFPSSGTMIEGGFFLVDKEGRTLVSVNRATTSNGITTTLQNSQTVNGAIRHCNLVLTINKNGDTYASVPTPSDATDSSTKVATTEWVNDINNDVVHKSRAETITGNKIFNDDYVLHSVANTDAGYWDKLITLPNVTGTSQMNVHLELIESFRNSNVKTSIARLMLVAINTGATANWVSVNSSGTFDTSRFKVVFTSEGKTELWYSSTHNYWSCSCRVINANMRNAPYKITDIVMGGSAVTTVEGTDVPIGNPKSAISTPTDATGQEFATANWVNNKLAQKNKVTNVTSYDQLMDLIKNGKRGDSFGLTVDYSGSPLGGITTTDAVETHAFGHYTIEEINVSDSTLNSFQAFGSGEVSGKFITDDTKTYVHATTGFGRAKVFEGLFDAFRVVEDGSLSYFIIGSANVTSFEGYYISI